MRGDDQVGQLYFQQRIAVPWWLFGEHVDTGAAELLML
jgi:hypothetical protein